MTGTPHRSSLQLQCLAYLSLGAPIALLGVGWPGARERFGASEGALGLVVLGYGLGRLATSPTALAILRRWHIRTATSALLAGVAVSGIAIATTRSYAVLVGAMTALGLLTGAADSLGNRYQSVIRDVGAAGLAFGSYAVGSTLGPAVLAITSWPVAFAASAGLAALTAGLALRPTLAWPDALDAPEPPRSRADRFDVPATAIALSLAVFAFYSGLEVVTANWAASYLEGHREMAADAAALAMSGFWAGMTVGRFGLGALSRRAGLAPARILTGAGLALAVLYLLLPTAPLPVSVAALALAGLAISVVFPTLSSSTADRVGVAAAGRMVTMQLLVANVSATALSYAVGAGVDRIGTGVPGVVFAVLAVGGIPVLLGSVRLHPDPRPAPEPAPSLP
ncbi:MAG: MFS transporter [Acidimicrobiales bacterium]|nr:MFS transporter [Acidimicrobiales bacterium]